MVDKQQHLYVFYGSQTGCAESIAKRVHSDALERNIQAEIKPLNDFEKCGIMTEENATVFIVCSTTGNGDPPSNAEKFWRFLKKKAHPNTLMKHIRITVLALGDTNYDKFCYMGKNINRRFLELGATTFYDIGCADEAMGLEDYVEPWIHGLWETFSSQSTVIPVEPTEPAKVEMENVSPKSSIDHLHIYFGSQTGCAESIAKRIQSDATERCLSSELRPLNEFEKSGILTAPTAHVLIVCSTTGNGDPPNNSEKFWRFLKKKAHPPTLLQHIKFTVLALGDTNYDKFCYMGKNIHRRMKELGAESMYDIGCADEAMGLEDSVEPWVHGFWNGIGDVPVVLAENKEHEPAATSIPADGNSTANPSLLVVSYLTAFRAMFPEGAASVDPSRLPRLQDASLVLTFDDQVVQPVRETDFLATMTQAKYLTTSASERKVLWLEFDTTGSGITFVPGDSIGIRCPNDPDIVEYLLSRLQVPKEQHKSTCVIQSTKKGGAKTLATIHDLLTHQYDLRGMVKKATLRALASYCTNETEQTELLFLSSKDGPSYFQQFVEAQRLSLVEILALFPSCQPPIAHVLSLLPNLSPRYYSIASSPMYHSNRIQIALTVVNYDLPVGTALLPRHGLCSTWLDQLAQPFLAKLAQSTPIQVPLFHHPTKDFVLPANTEWPLILIGPGTGVSPFIGFLQHRQLQKAKHSDDSESCGYWRGDVEVDNHETNFVLGSIDLFFGCRRRHEDFLFQKELDTFVATEILTKLHVAASREQETKHYVQHDIANEGARLYELIEQKGGFVYVCGDGMKMAKDVHETLIQLYIDHGKLSREEALNRWKDLALRQRYVRDIWG